MSAFPADPGALGASSAQRPQGPDDIDLTVLVLATVWSEDAHRLTLGSIQALMAESGLKVQTLLTEMLPPSTDAHQLGDRPTDLLPAVWREALGFEGFDYLCEYGATARGLRRAVRSARGHYVCVIREGDEVGHRRHADQRLRRRDLDVLLAVSAGAEGSLAAHRAMAAAGAAGRGLSALVGLLGAYDGALVLRRDYLDDLLGQVSYDANPGYIGYLTELVLVAALRDSARVQFTEQLAVFPHEYHQRVHREHAAGYVLHCLPVRRREVGPRWEPTTERLIDGLLGALRDMVGGHTSAPWTGDPAQERDQLLRGELTQGLLGGLWWLVGQLRRLWGWLPDGNAVPVDLAPHRLADAPATPPRVSLLTSAFQGQHVAHSFLANLTAQQGSDDIEILLVTPQPNLVQDLVFEAFARAWPQVRLLPLDEDPGIYACWNHAAQAARGRYLSNANLDDRRDRRHVQHLADLLDRSGADVASTAMAITQDLQDITGFDGDVTAQLGPKGWSVWYGQAEGGAAQDKTQRDFFLFGPGGEVTQCMNFPHCMPMWRRSVHERFGVFDEAAHGTYADFALWLHAISNGARFIHDPTPLGLYFVDPQSHNRRNSNAITWDALVRRYLPAGTPIHAPEHVRVEAAALQLPPGPLGGVKLNFGKQLAQNYGNHRSGWSYVMQAFEDFHDPASPVYCNTFLEKRFVWGGDAGDGGCGPVAPHREPWVGFVHVPPHVPSWFQFEQSNEQIFRKESWRRSLRECRGLFVLTDYHRQSLLALLRPDFPISVLYHPTEFVDEGFSMDAFDANPDKRLVQIGWWLRKLQAANYLQVSGYTPTLLGRSDWTKNILAHAERRYHGIQQLPPVATIDFLDNDAYDRLLTRNLVFIDFYDTSANNAVIECIARATPIVVCRHPAVEEYLGQDYPLFYDHAHEVAALVADRGRLAAAHQHLLQPALRERLTLAHFQRSLAESEVMRALQ